MSDSLNDAIARELLPDAGAAALLAAAVGTREFAREGWQRWCSLVAAAPAEALAGDERVARTLLPLLYDSARRNGLPLDAATSTYLRSALVRESLRGRIYREIADELVSRMRSWSIALLVIKGAATGPLYYADPALRHAHDVELLIERKDLPAAARSLDGSDFRRVGRGWVHRSGLPLRIRTRLFDPSLSRDDAVFWADSVPCGSTGWMTLHPSHALALAIVEASRSPVRGTGRWIADAAAIIGSASVDWDRLADAVRTAGADLSAAVQLRWLRDELALAIPEETIDGLAGPRRAAVEIALRGVAADSPRVWQRLWFAAKGSERLSVARALLFPSTAAAGWRRGDGLAGWARAYASLPAALSRTLMRGFVARLRNRKRGEADRKA